MKKVMVAICLILALGSVSFAQSLNSFRVGEAYSAIAYGKYTMKSTGTVAAGAATLTVSGSGATDPNGSCLECPDRRNHACGSGHADRNHGRLRLERRNTTGGATPEPTPTSTASRMWTSWGRKVRARRPSRRPRLEPVRPTRSASRLLRLRPARWGYTIYISLTGWLLRLGLQGAAGDTAIDGAGPYPASNGVCTLTKLETITPACAVANTTYGQTGSAAIVSALTLNTSPIDPQITTVSSTTVYTPNAGGRTTAAYVPGSHIGVGGLNAVVPAVRYLGG
jgi:hypothetical protein